MAYAGGHPGMMQSNAMTFMTARLTIITLVKQENDKSTSYIFHNVHVSYMILPADDFSNQFKTIQINVCITISYRPTTKYICPREGGSQCKTALLCDFQGSAGSRENNGKQ